MPPGTTFVLAEHVGTNDCTELSFPGGHIGVYVGGRSQKTFTPVVADWLRSRDQRSIPPHTDHLPCVTAGVAEGAARSPRPSGPITETVRELVARTFPSSHFHGS